MTTPQIKWEIVDLNVYSDKGIDNIIHSIKWAVTASDEKTSATKLGSAILPYPEEGKFLSIDQITKELAEQWLFESLGDAKIEFEQSVIAELNMLTSQVEPQKPSWLAPAVPTEQVNKE